MEKHRDYYRRAGTGRRTPAHLVFGGICLATFLAGLWLFYRAVMAY